MIVPHYKVILLSDSPDHWVWNEVYQVEALAYARCGYIDIDKERTFRIDIDSGLFRVGNKRIGRDLTDLIASIFTNVSLNTIKSDRTYIMLWSSSDQWLNHKKARRYMEVWNGLPHEQRSVWGGVTKLHHIRSKIS